LNRVEYSDFESMAISTDELLRLPIFITNDSIWIILCLSCVLFVIANINTMRRIKSKLEDGTLNYVITLL